MMVVEDTMMVVEDTSTDSDNVHKTRRDQRKEGA